MERRFFILGCQRTGTTLMRLVLESHPDLYCYDELRSYAVLQKSVAAEFPPSAHVGFKIPRWTEQLACPVLWDEGPEGPCENFYRGETIVFLLRDVRDTVASMFKLKSGNANWCEIWVPQIIEAKLARDATFRARYSAELEMVENCHNRLVGLAALYWKYKTDAFFLYREKAFPVLPVCYEQLVTHPRPILHAVCAHLGMAFHENLLRHNEFRHAELFGSGLTLGDTDPRRPIGKTSVGQWTRFLGAADIDLIARIAGELPAKVAAVRANVVTRAADPAPSYPSAGSRPARPESSARYPEAPRPGAASGPNHPPESEAPDSSCDTYADRP